MTTVLRAIETEQYRLVHYALDSGDEYFVVSQDAAPEVLRTSSQHVNLTPHSTLNGYKDVASGLVFISNKPAGITVLQADRSIASQVFLFKNRSEQEKFPLTPVPLVPANTSPADIQVLSDRIRLITSQRRLSSLGDFGHVTDALYRAVTKTAREAETAIRIADESLSFLLDTLQTLPSDEKYANIRQTTLEQMRIKLESYNKLTILVDRLLDQRQEIEQLTRRLQESVRPITQIAREMPLVS